MKSSFDSKIRKKLLRGDIQRITELSKKQATKLTSKQVSDAVNSKRKTNILYVEKLALKVISMREKLLKKHQKDIKEKL